jgi:hypothetical protein
VPSDSAPPADSDAIILAADRAGKQDDPVRRLLTEPPGPASGLQVRHWVGVVILALAVGGAAFVLPPLISATGPTAPSPGVTSAGPQAAGPPAPAAPVPSAGASTRGSAPARPQASVPAVNGAGSTRPTTTSKPATAKSTGPAAVTPSPTKAATGTFTAMTVQAENATLSDGAKTTDCESCGGGQRVRYLGRVDARFDVAASGERTITVTCSVGDNFRELSVTVNGTALITRRKVSGNSWEELLTVSAKTSVPAGPVTVAVFGAPNGPDIDAISIS